MPGPISKKERKAELRAFASTYFEKTHAMAILLVLWDGPCCVSELTDMVSNSSGSVNVRLDEMIEMGLVVIDRMNFKPFRKMVSLTPKGRKVANGLRMVESSMKEDRELKST